LLNKDNNQLLPNGTLIINVNLQVQVEKRAVWYPPTPTCIPNDDTQMLADLLLETGSCSDVTFQVGHQDFRLHSFILKKRAAALFQMIDEHTDQTIITLAEEDDVDAAVFRIIVRYIYTSEWPDRQSPPSLLMPTWRNPCWSWPIALVALVSSITWNESVKFLDETTAADMLLLGDSFAYLPTIEGSGHQNLQKPSGCGHEHGGMEARQGIEFASGGTFLSLPPQAKQSSWWSGGTIMRRRIAQPAFETWSGCGRQSRNVGETIEGRMIDCSTLCIAVHCCSRVL
jgi:BTB/POZ domain